MVRLFSSLMGQVLEGKQDKRVPPLHVNIVWKEEERFLILTSTTCNNYLACLDKNKDELLIIERRMLEN